MKSHSRRVAAFVLAAVLSIQFAPMAFAKPVGRDDFPTKIERIIQKIKRIISLIPNDDSPIPPTPTPKP